MVLIGRVEDKIADGLERGECNRLADAGGSKFASCLLQKGSACVHPSRPSAE